MNSQEKQIIKDNSKINDKYTTKNTNIIKKDDNIDTQNDEISCWGCETDEPNQLAHMDIGGCLYNDSEEL